MHHAPRRFSQAVELNVLRRVLATPHPLVHPLRLTKFSTFKPSFQLYTSVAFYIYVPYHCLLTTNTVFFSPSPTHSQPPRTMPPRFPLLWGVLSVCCLYLSLKWGTSDHNSNFAMEGHYESAPFWKTWQGFVVLASPLILFYLLHKSSISIPEADTKPFHA